MYSTKIWATIATGTIAMLGAQAAYAGPLVVRSTGPSAKAYPVGKPLAADAKLPLKAGDVVTVLDSTGTRVLRGPGTLPVVGSAAASGAGFKQLIANAGTRQARTGATRSVIGGGPARSPNVWYVDASKGGTQCIVDANLVSLWRPADAAAEKITITRVADGKSVELDYRIGQSVRQWPVADMPLTEGGQYKIALRDAKAPVTIKATLLNDAADDLERVATSLLGKGCTNQMDVLVEGSRQELQLASAAH